MPTFRLLKRVVLLSTLAMSFAVSVPAAAQDEAETLDRAIDLFERGDYLTAQELLTGIDRAQLSAEGQSLRERIDVDGLVVVTREGGALSATLYSAHGETRAEAPLGNRADDVVAKELASGLFPSPTASVADEAEKEAGLSPWVVVGAGAGGAVVTGLVAGRALAALWWWDADVKSRSLKVEVAR